MLIPDSEYVPDGHAATVEPVQLTPAGHVVQVLDFAMTEYSPEGQF